MKITAKPQKATVSANPQNARIATGTPVIKVTEHIPDAVWNEGETITRNPVFDIDYETGTVSAAYDDTISTHPIVQSGVASNDTVFPVRVKGNTATQLFTQPETVYTPSDSAQIVPSGRFLTGDQTILPVAPPYYDMSGAKAYLGADAQLVKTFTAVSTKLSATGFNGWQPSTTAKDIVTTEDLGTFVASDMPDYEYYIQWECTLPIVYTGSPTHKALPLFCVSSQLQSIYKRPSSWANIESNIWNGNVCASIATGTFMRYYGSTAGTLTYTWGTSYGFYWTLTAATFNSTTTNTPTVTVKTPKLTARCSTTYMSTGNAALIDQDKSIITVQAKVYKAKASTMFRGNYANTRALVMGAT